MSIGIVIQILFCCLLAVFFGGGRLIYVRHRDNKRLLAWQAVEYVEYSTDKRLDKLWFDMSLIGACPRCGCDDSPLMPGANICKWCIELAFLQTHLQNHERQKENILHPAYYYM